MKNFLFILERAWLLAAGCAVALGMYNLVANRLFDQSVYFPIFCAFFCVLIFWNIRGQRRFNEKMMEQEKLER